MTVPNGLKGQYTIKFDIHSEILGKTVYGRVYLNNAVFGAEQSTSTTSWTTMSAVFTHDCDAGDEIQLWLKADSSSDVYSRNFRIYYDDGVVADIAVASSQSFPK